MAQLPDSTGGQQADLHAPGKQFPTAIVFENSVGEWFELLKELEKLDVGRQEIVLGL